MSVWDTIYKVQNGIVSRDIAGESIKVPIVGSLLDMEKIYSVNKIGEFIWQKLDGKTALAKILNDILDKFDVEKEQVEADILAFIEDLSNNNLITKG